MKKIFIKSLYFFMVFIFTPYSSCFSSDGDISKLQGVVMEIDFKNNLFFVNEKPFIFDKNTIISDEKGNTIPLDRIKKNVWVYIEWSGSIEKKNAVAKKIYLLPRYIDKKDKNLYQFIK